MPKTEYQALTTTEAKRAAIAEASTPAELDAMWAAWEERGFSRDGLLYADVLARKAELGHELSETEADTLRLAAARRRAGAELPTITGRQGRGRR